MKWIFNKFPLKNKLSYKRQNQNPLNKFKNSLAVLAPEVQATDATQAHYSYLLAHDSKNQVISLKIECSLWLLDKLYLLCKVQGAHKSNQAIYFIK